MGQFWTPIDTEADGRAASATATNGDVRMHSSCDSRRFLHGYFGTKMNVYSYSNRNGLTADV